MAYDEALATRLRAALAATTKSPVVEKKMFGGVAFMVDEKMCVGVHEKRLMVRVGPEKHEQALREAGASVMDFTHRPMVGFMFVDATGYRSARDLEKWIKWSLEYTATVPAKKKGKG